MSLRWTRGCYYGGPQVKYSSDMHIAALPSSISSLLGTFRLFQALFGHAERFFCYAMHFSSILSGVSALPSSFQLCWALFCSANHFSSVLGTYISVKHFSATLSTFRLHQTCFFYTERLFRSAKHFASMLNISPALPSIFLLRWVFFFCSAKHFLLCRAVQSRAEK